MSSDPDFVKMGLKRKCSKLERESMFLKQAMAAGLRELEQWINELEIVLELDSDTPEGKEETLLKLKRLTRIHEAFAVKC